LALVLTFWFVPFLTVSSDNSVHLFFFSFSFFVVERLRSARATVVLPSLQKTTVWLYLPGSPAASPIALSFLRGLKQRAPPSRTGLPVFPPFSLPPSKAQKFSSHRPVRRMGGTERLFLKGVGRRLLICANRSVLNNKNLTWFFFFDDIPPVFFSPPLFFFPMHSARPVLVASLMASKSEFSTQGSFLSFQAVGLRSIFCEK